MLTSKGMNGVFSHAVFTTMWNLMSRVGNAVSICKSHLQWSEDALLIFFAHEKTDQTQSKPGDPRHIYANPYQPSICPILSLGIFFLVTDVSSSRSNFVFPGDSQYGRFQKSLMTRYADENFLGHSLDSFGTHSIRKGAATYASSGSTACPSYAAIANRAGWTMGVSSLYIQYQSAGDQYVGRTVCGLNSLDPSFAVLPPCFKQDVDPSLIHSILKTCFSRFDDVTPELRKVLTMTTASVIYHMQWLSDNLPPDHCLFSTALFSSDFGEPLSDLVECHTWRPGDIIKATGIPPHVSITLHTIALTEAVSSLPERVSRSAQEFIDSQPDRPLSAERVGSIVREACDRLFERLQHAHERQQEPQQQRRDSANRARVPLLQLYVTKNGKFSKLPPDFRLPRGNLKTAWEHYCCSDEARGIPALRSVNGFEMDRKLSTLFTRYRKLMDAIYRKAVEQNVWEEPPASREVANNILNSIDLSEILPFHVCAHRGSKRLDELSWITLSNDLYHSRRMLRQHPADPQDEEQEEEEE